METCNTHTTHNHAHKRTRTHTHAHAHTHTRTRTRTRARTRTRTHTHTRTRTHTHTHNTGKRTPRRCAKKKAVMLRTSRRSLVAKVSSAATARLLGMACSASKHLSSKSSAFSFFVRNRESKRDWTSCMKGLHMIVCTLVCMWVCVCGEGGGGGMQHLCMQNQCVPSPHMQTLGMQNQHMQMIGNAKSAPAHQHIMSVQVSACNRA